MDFFDLIPSKTTRKARKCCVVRRCRNSPEPHRRFCRRCRDRRYKILHPLEFALNKLRNNARRRGHEFTLTRDEWAEFCAKYRFLDRVGKSAESLTVDRIDPQYGYHLWNIQPLTNSENARKAHAQTRP